MLMQPVQADSYRHVYLAPHLPVTDYPLLASRVQGHAIWQIPLNLGERQIIRVQDFSLTESAPFYRSQTRLDERNLTVMLKIKLEIWSADQLIWQEAKQLERQIRLLGPELQGVGIALIPRLNQQTEGSLSQWPELRKPAQKAQQDLITMALEQLKQDYLNQKNRTQENTP